MPPSGHAEKVVAALFPSLKAGTPPSCQTPAYRYDTQFAVPILNAKKGHVKSAKEFFGETNNWNETGYITTDGTKLDFSDYHEGASGEHHT